jgi:hypothetical protein
LSSPRSCQNVRTAVLIYSVLRSLFSYVNQISDQPLPDALEYRVFHFEVSISVPRLDLGSKSQQILIFARARSICDFQPLGAKARAMPVDCSDARYVKPVR